MKQPREELLRKKREYARRQYRERREHIVAILRKSQERAKLANPDGYAAKQREYKRNWVLRNPEKRQESSRKYFEANRAACIARSVESMRKRKQHDPAFCLTILIRNRFTALLATARCKPTTAEALEIREWFEWLREKGVVDWTQPGIEIDHVIPVSRLNIENPEVVAMLNSWRNLFPIDRATNRRKHGKIWPAYIQRVRELSYQFEYERRAKTVA